MDKLKFNLISLLAAAFLVETRHKLIVGNRRKRGGNEGERMGISWPVAERVVEWLLPAANAVAHHQSSFLTLSAPLGAW